MAQIQGLTTTNTLEVNADNALRVEVRPIPVGTLGSYGLSAVTGSVAATLAAGSTLFSMRWTDATRLCLIRSLRVSGIVNAAVTAAVQFDLEAIVARSFSGADTGGTTIATTTNNNKMRTSQGTSLFASGALLVSSTGTLTAGTRTVDGNAIGRIQGYTGTAVGTNIFGSGSGPMYILDRQDVGQYPLTLATNEGLLIRNPLAGPATGTFQLVITVEWMETIAF